MTGLCAGNRRVRDADGRTLELWALTPGGLAVLRDDGWEALRRRLDRPRAWFLDEPLFESGAAPRVSPEDAFAVSRERVEPDGAHGGTAGLKCLLYVHPEIRWFAGHFPGRPILPGVVQIGWAARHGETLGFAGERFAGLSGVKFAAPVPPGAVVTLTLTVAAPDRLSFVTEGGQGVHSRGVLRYRA